MPATSGLTVAFSTKFRHFVGLDKPMGLPEEIEQTPPEGTPTAASQSPTVQDRPSTIRQMVLMAENRSRKLVGLFAGHSYEDNPLEELQEMYEKSTECRIVLQKADGTLREFASQGTVSQYLPNGLDIKEWLELQRPPDASYVRSPIVAWPVVFLYQIIVYLYCVNNCGYGYQTFHKAFSAFVANGQGLFTALCISSSPTVEALYDNLPTFLNCILWAAFHHQHVLQHIMKINTEKYQSFVPTYMLAVVGCKLEALDKFITEVNDYTKHKGATYSDVVISEILGPRAATMSGHPADLYRLYYSLYMFCKSTRLFCRLKFLPVEGPCCNVYYLSQLPRRMLNSYKRLGITLPTKYCIPVLSPIDGTDMTCGSSLLEDLVRITTILTQDLPRATQQLSNENVIDFGPGGFSGMGSFLNLCKLQLCTMCAPSMKVLPPPTDPNKPRRRLAHRLPVYKYMTEMNNVLADLVVQPANLNLDTRWESLYLIRYVQEAEYNDSPTSLQASFDDASANRGMGYKLLFDRGCDFSERKMSLASIEMPMPFNTNRCTWDTSFSSAGVPNVPALVSTAHQQQQQFRNSSPLANPYGQAITVQDMYHIKKEITPLGLLFIEKLSEKIGRHLSPILLLLEPFVEELINYLEVIQYLDVDKRARPNKSYTNTTTTTTTQQQPHSQSPPVISSPHASSSIGSPIPPSRTPDVAPQHQQRQQQASTQDAADLADISPTFGAEQQQTTGQQYTQQTGQPHQYSAPPVAVLSSANMQQPQVAARQERTYLI